MAQTTASEEREFDVNSPGMVLKHTKTYNGVSIEVAGGIVIGRIQEFSPTFASRAGKHIYELSRDTMGRPIDYVPGIESGRSISVSRVEVWEDELEVALGVVNTEFVDLADQTKPFTIIESLFRGTESYRQWEYAGCWFTEKSLDAMSSEGDMTVGASATINYVVRHKISV